MQQSRGCERGDAPKIAGTSLTRVVVDQCYEFKFWKWFVEFQNINGEVKSQDAAEEEMACTEIGVGRSLKSSGCCARSSTAVGASMRESNFSFPAQNRACVTISSQLYDRRGLSAFLFEFSAVFSDHG